MKNVKLRVKLMGGFCVTALLVLAVGLLAVFEEGEMAKQLDFIANQTSRGLEYALRVDSALTTVFSQVNFLLSNSLSKKDRQGVADGVAEARKNRNEMVKKFEDLEVAKDVEKDWQAYIRAIDDTVAVNNKVLTLSNELVDSDILNPHLLSSRFYIFQIEIRADLSKTRKYVQRHVPFEPVDESKCQFGQWLANPGTTNPTLVNLVSTIIPLHHAFHEKMRQAKELADAGKTDEANKVCAEQMEPLQEAIFAEIDKARQTVEHSVKSFDSAANILATEGVQAIGKVDQTSVALIDKLRVISRQAVIQADAAAATGKQISIVCMAVGVVLALTLGLLLTKAITKPLAMGVDLAKAMSAGDLTRNVNINQRDEIGVLAKSLNDMAASLRRMFGDIHRGVKNVEDASAQLAALSGQMSAGTEQAASLSSQVAAAAEEMSGNQNTVAAAMEQASVNVNMVASAAEEMSATISEIAVNSAKAKDITGEAVNQSRKASERVSELGRAADEIDKVTEVITEISEQTNLLALNATIEAARAGEAGKGFAVVANEIKDLAKQTAGATLDIKNKIAGIQQATGVTVKEISEIQQIITDVDCIVSTIATAVEEQSATTKEIAQNVNQASAGITEVNENVAQSSTAAQAIAEDIARVSQSAKGLSEAGGQVRDNSGHLKTVSDGLKKLVEQFKI